MTDTTDPLGNSSLKTSGFNRRTFIAGAAGTAVAPLAAKAAAPATAPPLDPSLPVDVTLSVNGDSKPLRLDSRTTLLDALREHIGLTGSKKGCDHGQCGACTVLVDGRRGVSCLTLALAAESRALRTAMSCIRCSRPSSIRTHSSAAIAHRDRSCPQWRA